MPWLFGKWAGDQSPRQLRIYPSVFASLPRLLERSGTSQHGSITGFYTVLVDGDDLNEPVSDAVGEYLTVTLFFQGTGCAESFPAIDILNSVSRLMPFLIDEEHKNRASRVRDLLAAYRIREDLINIGAYVKGSNSRVDMAIAYRDRMEAFLRQDMNAGVSWEESCKALRGLFNDLP